MSFLAPYTNAMRLGQGFNSYTQEICIDDAVLIYASESTKADRAPEVAKAIMNGTNAQTSAVDFTATPINGLAPLKLKTATETTKTNDAPHHSNTTTPVLNPQAAQRSLTFSTMQGDHTNQIVTFNSRAIENLTDVMDALNVSTSASIKYGTVKAGGSASLVNEHNINESDLNYLVTVKVTNEYEPPPARMEFLPIPGMPAERFTQIYGDCFISGFLEGGEFTAIVSIKVHKKSNLKKVKLAAELCLNVGPSPVAVGASASTDKESSDAWSDTETTIAVSWCGGGEVKKAEKNWSLTEVISAANEFPNQVARYSQRTSAILMDYRSLRSFHTANFKLPKPFVIAEYGICEIYTTDLFSNYMAFKSLWKLISAMIKEPRAYKALPKTKDVPDPIQTDAISLNNARIECRKGMTLVLQEIKILEVDPSVVGVKVDGTTRIPPFKFPAQLKERLPRYVGLPAEDPGLNNAGLSTAERAALAKYANNPDLSFSALVGDDVLDKESRPFCSLDVNPTQDLDHVVAIRVHGHKHHHFDVVGDWHRFSKLSERAIAAIGFTTARDQDSTSRTSEAKGKCPCSCVNHVGSKKAISELCAEDEYLSRLADISSHAIRNSATSKDVGFGINSGGVTKVSILYAPGGKRVAGLKLYGPGGIEVLNWDMYDKTPASERPYLKEVVQTPPVEEDPYADPDKRNRWVLAGVWGMGDIVVNRLGAIWKRV